MISSTKIEKVTINLDKKKSLMAYLKNIMIVNLNNWTWKIPRRTHFLKLTLKSHLIFHFTLHQLFKNRYKII